MWHVTVSRCIVLQIIMVKSLFFLGTSHGAAEKGRACSSAVYRFGGTSFLMDMGEPVAALLRENDIGVGSLCGALITHFHTDHMGGIFQLLFCTPKAEADRKPVWFFPEERNIEAFCMFNSATFGGSPYDKVDLRVFPKDGSICFKDNALCEESAADVRITAYDNDHMKHVGARSISYMLEADGMRILHTGDLVESLSDLASIIGNTPVDYCICEGTHWYWELDKAINVLKNAPIRHLIFNHISPRFFREGRNMLLEIGERLPYSVEIAHDRELVIFR